MYIIYKRKYDYESKSFIYQPGKKWNYRFSVGHINIEDKEQEEEKTHGFEPNMGTNDDRGQENNGTNS